MKQASFEATRLAAEAAVIAIAAHQYHLLQCAIRFQASRAHRFNACGD
jgi:hypothetical protein